MSDKTKRLNELIEEAKDITSVVVSLTSRVALLTHEIAGMLAEGAPHECVRCKSKPDPSMMSGEYCLPCAFAIRREAEIQ